MNKTTHKFIHRAVFYGLVLFLTLLGIRPTAAVDIDTSNLIKDADVLQMQVGEVKDIQVNIPKRIAITNPNVADVTDVTSAKIVISAKASGSTMLTYTDSFGEQSIRIRVMAEDTQELKRRIDSLLADISVPDVYTQAWPQEDKVAVLGKVNTEEERQRVISALVSLRDKYVNLITVNEEERVVEIDVQLLEVNKGFTSNLGFNWPSGVSVTEQGSPAITQLGAQSITNTTGVGGTTSQSTFTQETPGTGFGSLFRILNVSRDAFVLTINALVSDGKARILSRPRLACQSGKEAELFVGGEKPILTTSVAATTGAEATSVDYKEYGIRLKIKPIVTKENRIKLVVNMEVSEIDNTAETLGSVSSITAKAFPLTKRTASTEIFMDDGQTLAIGGLTKQKTEEEFNEVPFLGKIPIIGAAFRNKTKRIGGGSSQKGNTELFITLTPTIIGNQGPSLNAIRKDLAQSMQENSGFSSPSEGLRDHTMNLVEYSNAVQKRILEALRYPQSAKEAGFQGTVKLRMRISYVGELMEAVVKESSGYKILDDSALKTAKEVGYFPPFPSSIDLKDIWIDVPIVYKVK